MRGSVRHFSRFQPATPTLLAPVVSRWAMRLRHDISLGLDELSCPRPVG